MYFERELANPTVDNAASAAEMGLGIKCYKLRSYEPG